MASDAVAASANNFSPSYCTRYGTAAPPSFCQSYKGRVAWATTVKGPATMHPTHLVGCVEKRGKRRLSPTWLNSGKCATSFYSGMQIDRQWGVRAMSRGDGA